jgi:hypothetical protein
MTAMRLKRYPSPSDGFALGKMGVGATLLKQGKTARDYVQTGLVAMWDGIENAGWGTHSDDTTVTWTDLILGVSISFGTWRMRGDLSRFIFVGNRVNNFDRFSLPQSVLSALTSGADTTIEIVCGDPTASGNEAIVAAIPDASTFYGQGGVFAGGGTAGIGLRNNLNGVRYPSPAVVKTLAPGVMATYSAVISNGTVYGYRNGKKLDVSLGADTSKVATSTLLQRMYAYANIRLSSRALTADEIARNYAVDKERFNLP